MPPTSQYRGVCWYPRGQWQASIRIQGRSKHLGFFLDEEEAARAYDKVAKRQWLNAPLNFLPDGSLNPDRKKQVQPLSLVPRRQITHKFIHSLSTAASSSVRTLRAAQQGRGGGAGAGARPRDALSASQVARRRQLLTTPPSSSPSAAQQRGGGAGAGAGAARHGAPQVAIKREHPEAVALDGHSDGKNGGGGGGDDDDDDRTVGVPDGGDGGTDQQQAEAPAAEAQAAASGAAASAASAPTPAAPAAAPAAAAAAASAAPAPAAAAGAGADGLSAVEALQMYAARRFVQIGGEEGGGHEAHALTLLFRNEGPARLFLQGVVAGMDLSNDGDDAAKARLVRQFLVLMPH